MTLKDLYLRVKDSTGLEVLTVSDMYTMYRNCAADLTSRGYREFVELEIPAEDLNFEGTSKLSYETEKTLGKILYVKIDTGDRLIKAIRVPLTHKGLDTINKEGIYSFDFNTEKGIEAIYYIKNKKIFCEIKNNKKPIKIIIGYYKRIETDIIPNSFEYVDSEGNIKTSTNVYDPLILETIELPIREELQDCFVFYGIYFCYNKRLKEHDLIMIHLNNYKYLVEDILHELNYEDNFNEEESVIVLEDV